MIGAGLICQCPCFDKLERYYSRTPSFLLFKQEATLIKESTFLVIFRTFFWWDETWLLNETKNLVLNWLLQEKRVFLDWSEIIVRRRIFRWSKNRKDNWFRVSLSASLPDKLFHNLLGMCKSFQRITKVSQKFCTVW